MEPETTAELLGRVPIFQGLKPNQLTAITAIGQDTYFESGVPMLMAGETGHTAYLILNGFVALDPHYETEFDDDEVLGYGTFLGELAMLVETTFTITVIARWAVRTLAIPREAMSKLMEEDPSIAHHFACKLVERLQRMADAIRRAENQFAVMEAGTGDFDDEEPEILVELAV